MSIERTIIYTHTDEAPALATYSFLPVIQAFTQGTGMTIETRDISLAGRVLAAFPERLTPEQRIEDELAALAGIVASPHANVIKLPNISASVPQLSAAIAELRAQGYDVPLYPEEPKTDEERDVRARYDAVKGSAVNPVLRQGNSDRRAPKAVKAFARANPHRMGAWTADNAAHVASMSSGDFRGNEQSVTIGADTTLRIEFIDAAGATTTMRENIEVGAGDVVDSTFMSVRALIAFLEQQLDDARERGVLFSLHLKATMMKVSDPIIFGHAVKVFFRNVWKNHAETIGRLGIDANNGLGALTSRLGELPIAEREAIEADITAALKAGPGLAMVDSDRGITNLHVPSDVIIDASMPAMIRDSGQMWDADGGQQQAKAVIPDRSYAGVYQTVIDFCREHGAFDPATMGSVPNVGLMAMKAEEYGSHDRTFEVRDTGVMRVVDGAGNVLMQHGVEAGDLWRMCHVCDVAVRDWVRLAVTRARASGAPAVFWLDADRPHDAQLIEKVHTELNAHDTDGLELHIMTPDEATLFSLQRMKSGEDTISVTGNVLRDYLTDLFPILEVGTSAKMLSIVPLLDGGGLFETGAGGSAPKHVQQFERENHLRWDSLGEFLALAASLEHYADHYDDDITRILAKTLDAATEQYLLQNKAPSRSCGELDNRGSHFYLAMFWARALAEQTEDADLARRMAPIAREFEANESTIVDELNRVQGQPMNIGGYYHPDPSKAAEAMRPSETFNAILTGALAGST